MMKYFIIFTCIFIFIYSCSSTPEINETSTPLSSIEEPVSTTPPISTITEVPEVPVDKNMKFGYVLVPGMDLVETSRGVMIVLETPVHFELRKYNVQEQYLSSFKVIKEFVKYNSATIVRLVIEGHTDIIGKASPTNIKLSNRRSLVGIEKLSNMGFSRTLMRGSALSEALPAYFGNEEYKNRRLEFIVMKDKNDISKYENVVSKLDLKKDR